MASEEINVRAPLFDRLVDPPPFDRSAGREHRPFRTLDRQELRESVRRELQRLFNSRAAAPVSRLEERELTVIDYGVPDFATLSLKNPLDRERMAAILVRTVTAFEPRLREVRVEVRELEGEKAAMWATVDGMLVFDSVREPISFPAILRPALGASEVRDAT